MNKITQYIKALFSPPATGQKRVYPGGRRTSSAQDALCDAIFGQAKCDQDAENVYALPPDRKDTPTRIRIGVKGSTGGKFYPLNKLPKYTIRFELPEKTRADIKALTRQAKAGPPPDINDNWATDHAARLYTNGNGRH